MDDVKSVWGDAMEICEAGHVRYLQMPRISAVVEHGSRHVSHPPASEAPALRASSSKEIKDFWESLLKMHLSDLDFKRRISGLHSRFGLRK